MPAIDFVTCCMGRLAFLQQTLPVLALQPESTCTVVDYSCPNGCGDWVAAHFPAVKVVRVPDRNRYNHPEALNAGGRAGRSPWICFIDCDIRLDPTFLPTVQAQLAPGNYYRFAPVYDKGIVGTCLCSRSDYERIEGYDEALCEYGENDLDLYHRVELLGTRLRQLSSSLIHHIPHDDTARLARMDVKDLPLALAIGRTYRFMKYDLMQLSGGALNLSTRQALFRAAFQTVNNANPSGSTLYTNYKTEVLPNGVKLERSLQFKLVKP